MDNRPIGVFDSGIGGMTVVKEIRKEYPNEDIIYFGDTIHFPYGNRSKESIIELTRKGINFLINKNVKFIIIACGTATSQALDIVSQEFDIPIIGIIDPTAKYLASNNNYKNIGVIATCGTIKSNAWEKNILKYNPNLNIISKACPLLAQMAEEGWTENEIAKLTIHEYLKDIKDIDALVLGCTHYPLFFNVIKLELGENVEIINTGTILAKNLKERMDSNNKQNDGFLNIYLSDINENFIKTAKILINKENLDIFSI